MKHNNNEYKNENKSAAASENQTAKNSASSEKTTTKGCGCGCGCNEVIGATRYDLGIMNQLSQKDATIARLEVSQETDKKILDLYKYIAVSGAGRVELN